MYSAASLIQPQNQPPEHPSPLHIQSLQEESKSACQSPHHKGGLSRAGGAPWIVNRKGDAEIIFIVGTLYK
ncbi:MAG: hypothetical protein K0A89_10335 [ANME-2 cluster archaeon]|nr:hypothetical protein [ANME-2 cluster archaeon]